MTLIAITLQTLKFVGKALENVFSIGRMKETFRFDACGAPDAGSRVASPGPSG
jgi:hypothetical protein